MSRSQRTCMCLRFASRSMRLPLSCNSGMKGMPSFAAYLLVHHRKLPPGARVIALSKVALWLLRGRRAVALPQVRNLVLHTHASHMNSPRCSLVAVLALRWPLSNMPNNLTLCRYYPASPNFILAIMAMPFAASALAGPRSGPHSSSSPACSSTSDSGLLLPSDGGKP
jgi:hypothetical protein